jgi:hypothetical protein
MNNDFKVVACCSNCGCELCIFDNFLEDRKDDIYFCNEACADEYAEQIFEYDEEDKLNYVQNLDWWEDE